MQGEDALPAAPLTRRAATLQALRFGLLSLFLFAFLYYPHDPSSWPARAIGGYVSWVARAAAFSIGLADNSVALTQGTVIGGRYPLQIVLDCTALDVQALYLSAVLALRAPAGIALKGALSGLAFLALANLARIAALYFVGVYAPARFDLIHEDVMTFVMMACACLAFVTFARFASRASVRARSTP